MPTTAIAGFNGSVTNQSGGAEVVEWNADVEVEALPATSMSSGGNREVIAGLKSANGSMTAIGSRVVEGAVTNLQLDEGNTTGDLRLQFNAIVTRSGTTVPTEGRVEYTADFVSNGAITATTVP